MPPVFLTDCPDQGQTQAVHGAPPVGTFLNLPRAARNDIYRRVLVVAHPVYLFQDPGSPKMKCFAPDTLRQWLALLYTNRQVYDEARVILYRWNCFAFVDTSQQQSVLLETFFSSIGSLNASYISHISINFPVAEIEAGQMGKTLREDDIRSLRLLREKCASLETLETLVYGQSCTGPKWNSDEIRLDREALSHINTRFKELPTLSRILVRFYNGGPVSEVAEWVQRLGWTILPGP